MPRSAICMRLRPSNANGLVTTATVSAPDSRASSATTGAAPVPVPPPMPRGDEHEVGAVEDHREIFARLFGGFAAEVRVRARTEAAREVRCRCARVFAVLRCAQRLHVGVDGVEVDAGEPGFDHAVDGVAAAAAEAEDFDRRGVFGDETFRVGHDMRVLRKETSLQ